MLRHWPVLVCLLHVPVSLDDVQKKEPLREWLEGKFSEVADLGAVLFSTAARGNDLKRGIQISFVSDVAEYPETISPREINSGYAVDSFSGLKTLPNEA